MCRSITVELFAMAVGVVGECGRGSVHHMLEIISEINTLHQPVKADILFTWNDIIIITVIIIIII